MGAERLNIGGTDTQLNDRKRSGDNFKHGIGKSLNLLEGHRCEDGRARSGEGKWLSCCHDYASWKNWFSVTHLLNSYSICQSQEMNVLISRLFDDMAPIFREFYFGP